MQAKDIKPMQKEKKKGINIFYVLIMVALIAFIYVCFTTGLVLLAIYCGALTIFLSPIPDFFLVKMGRKPITKNMRFIVGTIGVILFCYLVPSDRIKAIRQQQNEALQEKMEQQLEKSKETEDVTELYTENVTETVEDNTEVGE